MGIDFKKADEVARRIGKELVPIVRQEGFKEGVVIAIRSILEEEFKESPSKLKPVSPMVFLKDIPSQEAKSEGGLYIPANKTQQDLQRATVLAVPSEIVMKKGTRRPCVVSPGMVILYEKCFGIEIEIEGESFVLLEERHIVGEMKED